ncbi:MAG: flippase-like domain-containing protein [Acidobacteria bacterium]|nr:flippase-like domain-containing protein [Acidobacteriota bacterium]
MTEPGRFLALRAVAAVVLVALVLRFVPPQQVLAALRASSPHWLIIAAIIVFGWRLIAARRLREFTQAQGMNVGSVRLFAVALISSFFGTMTPGYAFTGVVRWYLLSEAGRHKTEALAALFHDRLTDLTILVAMGLCGLLLSQAAVQSSIAMTIVALSILLFVSWVVSGSNLLTRPLLWSVSHLPQRLRPVAEKLVGALGRIRQMPNGTRLRVLLLSVASNALNAFGMYCLMRALGLPLLYYDALWLRCATFVVGAMPITILGLGVREGVLVVLLAPAGIAPQSAVALSVLILGRELLAGIAGGLTLAFWRGPSPLPRSAQQN